VTEIAIAKWDHRKKSKILIINHSVQLGGMVVASQRGGDGNRKVASIQAV